MFKKNKGKNAASNTFLLLDQTLEKLFLAEKEIHHRNSS